MLYGPQNILGAAELTPSQRAAQQRRREAAQRIVHAARDLENRAGKQPAAGEAAKADGADRDSAAAFFACAWRMLDGANNPPAMRIDLGSGPMRRIQDTVCAYYQIALADLTSSRRAQEFAHPRQVAMYLSRILTGRSLPEIGRRFGERKHTTVLHAVRQVTARLQRDPRLARDVAMITNHLKASSRPTP